jgi:hypothetical protein
VEYLTSKKVCLQLDIIEYSPGDQAPMYDLIIGKQTMQMVLVAMASAEKAAAAMAVNIIDCEALWRWSMVAAVMAVIVASSGGHCRWQRWQSSLTATARADAGNGRQGHKGEGVPMARCHPTATARARAMAAARETATARGTARAIARARVRARVSRQQQQLSTAAAAAAIPPPLLHCFPATRPSCQCCCYVIAEAVAGWVWMA